jgi:SanA protein
MLGERIDTGVALYKAGKVQKLLMTGDNSRPDYDEPDLMREVAIKQGVPPADVVCDYAGFRTFDSVYRARDIFGIRHALLVSESYHLTRAIFTARELGMDVAGVAAEKDTYPGQEFRDLREVAAIEKAWFDVHFGERPKYLGKQEALVGSSH